MTLEGAYFASRNPKEYVRFYVASFILLVVFIVLFDDWITALFYYLVLLILSFPFIIIYSKNKSKREQNELEEMIELENAQKASREIKRIDSYLDKTICMSCLAPVKKNESHCQQCGFKLRK